MVPTPGARPRRSSSSPISRNQARADLAGHLLSFRFVLHDLLTVPDETLDTPLLAPLPRLALGSMKYCKSEGLGDFFLAHVEDVRQLLTSKQGRRSLFFILDYTDSVHPFFDRASLIRLLVPVVGPELAPTMLTYEELVDLKYERRAYEKLCKRLAEDKQFAEEFLQKAMEEHVENAIEKRLETQRGQLLRLLARRFGALPDAVAARVAGAGAEDLDRWFDRLLDAASLDELFGEA